MDKITKYVQELPIIQKVNNSTKNIINLLLDQFQKSVQPSEIQQKYQLYNAQFDKLFKSLGKSEKMSILHDQNHRALIISFIKSFGIQFYKYSYFNRAKLTKMHLQRAQQIGPILFSEAVMIASKINLINKNNSRIFIQDHLYTQNQSHVDIKIQQILKLCDQKKRNVNSNLKKLQLILQGPDYLQIIKELGKMLRDSWKKDKSKNKWNEFVKKPQNNIMKKQNEVKEIQENQFVKCQPQKLSEYNNQCDNLSFTSSQEFIIKNINVYDQIFQKSQRQHMLQLNEIQSQQFQYFAKNNGCYLDSI